MKHLLLGLIVATTLVSVGDAAQRALPVYGLGLRSCGSWVLTKNNSALTARTERIALSAWVAGFITAAGFYAERELKTTDFQAMEVWLDQYCNANPIEPLNHAAMALVLDLLKE